MLRAAVNPAKTTVATWAAELVQTSNVDYLDRLIPNFIYPQLKAMGTKLHVRQYRRAENPGACEQRRRWPARGSAKGGQARSSGHRSPSITLSPTKLSVISTFSEEMATHSTPSIEGIIRQAMSDDTGVALDTYLIDDVAARPACVRPACSTA